MHPLPEDFSRASTYDIVEKIRCEAREGLRDVKPDHPILKHTAIGYDFVFEIDEDNNATKGELNFASNGFTKGTSHALDFSGSATRKRKNKREFRIVETLEQLNKASCAEPTQRANWVYPIAGAIGIDEVVRTYIRLERLTDLGTGFVNEKFGKDFVVFSEDLDFTTEIGGGVTPTLELATVAGKLKLSKATLFAEAKRKDVHSVTIALAQDGKPVDLKTIPFNRSIEMVRPRAANALVERGVNAKSRVLLELERRRLVKEDERLATKFLDALRPSP